MRDWLSKIAWYVPQENESIKWSHQYGRVWSKGVTKLRPHDTTEADEDKLPEELLEAAVSRLPGRPAEHIQPGNDQAHWTSQLSIGVYNLCSMTRKPHVPNLSRGARSRLNPEDLRYSLLIELINKSATRIVALCEANGLQLPAAEEKLKGWIIVQSSDCNLAVSIGNDKGATFKLLYDSTDYQKCLPRFCR